MTLIVNTVPCMKYSDIIGTLLQNRLDDRGIDWSCPQEEVLKPLIVLETSVRRSMRSELLSPLLMERYRHTPQTWHFSKSMGHGLEDLSWVARVHSFHRNSFLIP